MTLKIAIIIVTYNGAKWIEKCLKSLFKTSYENYGVIVVDNASIDESADIVRDFKGEYGQSVHLIRLDENKGFVGGNNVGIRYAMEKGYDAVVMLNQDTEVETDWLDHLVDASGSEEVGIAQAMLVLGNERGLTNNGGNAMHYLGFGFVKHYREDASQWLNREPMEIGYASGAAMLIKKDVLSVIAPARIATPARSRYSVSGGQSVAGGSEGTPERGNLTVDETLFSDDQSPCDDKIASSASTLPRNDTGYLDAKFFMYHEDLDLCWRARLAGFKIMLAPKAVVYHYYEFNRNKKMFYFTERNRWAVLLQNYEFSTLLMLGPMLFIIEMMMILYSTMSGWLNYKLQSYAWILKNLPKILSKRQQVQKMRRVDDKEIMKRMDAKLEFFEVSNPLLKHVVSPVVEWYFKIVK